METEGIEEEAEDIPEEALVMEVEEEGEGEEWGNGTIRGLGAIEILTQDTYLSRTTIVDSCNGFNKMSRLAMMWTVRHRSPTGARFTFNCYRHWAQPLLRQPRDPPVIILNREAVTQGYPLSMVLYIIIIFPLAEELRAADPGLLSPFYAYNAAFDGSALCSAKLLKLLIEIGPDRGYLTEPAKSLFISYIPGQDEATKREFEADGLELNSVSGSRYLGAYPGP